MIKTFIIRGYYDKHDHIWLYWSNKDGWVHEQTATVFDIKELNPIDFPMKTTAVIFNTVNEK